MKINILTLLFVLFTTFSCGNNKIAENDIETLILTVQTSKAESKPLNLILNLVTKNIIIYNANELHSEVPPPPDSISSRIKSNNNFGSYETEILNLNPDEVDGIVDILKNFEKDDYDSSIKTALDGTAITTSIFYSDNSMRKIILVNDSSNNQRKLFKHIFQILDSKTRQKNLIQKYYQVTS